MPYSRSYCNGSDFVKKIQAVLTEFQSQSKNLRFVVPSREDKKWWPLQKENLTIWTWQEIYEDIQGAKRRVLSPPDHLLILKSLLNDFIAEYKEKIKSLPGLERSGFAAVLSDDIRELLNEAVKPEQLIFDTESSNPAEFLLPEIYSKYISYLNQYNLLDSAQVYSAAHDLILSRQDWGKDYIMIFAGFLTFNHAQLELVRAIQDRCARTLFVKPDANMAGFHDADLQLGLAREKSNSSGKILELPSAEPGLEPEIIARVLSLWSAGKWDKAGEFPGFDAVGLMIEEGREEAFAESFRRYGVPYDFTEGIMINRTLPGKILSSLHNLSAKLFPAYDTAMLLTQPCFAGSSFPVMRAYRAGPSGIDSWIEYLSGRANNPDEELRAVFEKALKSAVSIKNFCGSMETAQTPAQIMSSFSVFLETQGLWLEKDDTISPYPELDESKRITASAVETVKDKALSLHELIPDLGKVKDYRLKGDEAYEYLADWCKNSHVRAPLQLSNSVRIFTGQPPVLSSFPVWIMSGVTQKTWSTNMKSSPLLGNEEREKLRENEAYLPRTKEKAEQREALFRRLVQTGERLTIISRPLLDSEGRPVSESPFVQKFLDEVKGWTKENVKSEGINILLGSDGFFFDGIDAGRRPSRKLPRIKAKANFVGASDIQELLECPFLWYQRRRAKLYQPDSELVSPAEWGNMLHKYWETVWKIYRKDMRAPGRKFAAIAESEWQRLLNGEGEDYSAFSFLARDSRLSRKREGLTFRAKRLAGVQALILDKIHENYEHENILLEDEAHLNFESDGVRFLGQCDRIELLRAPDGSRTAFIVDYKEGRMGSKSYDKGMKNLTGKFWHEEGEPDKFEHGLQLSLYTAMFSESSDVSGVYILGHEDGRVWGSFTDESSGIFEPFMPDGQNGRRLAPDRDIQGRIQEGRYAMACAVRILEAGEFSPDYDSQRCRQCHIKSLCRKGELRGEVLDSDDDDA